ncbi:phage repressor protein [Streptococcus azizii]|uniref:Phage repressor protein n=1 Tax=Streptococcus azizii TaxID=1579424 RepID=A0AB36JL06_9STRE|nr:MULTISPECIES: S24 family peptidase [Streptococcus]QBX22500.1 pleiotropic regulator of exopolysaccharide synthesis, competence and biofilm formation [Streptococcus phage Javan85]QBX31933.1 pleiotropic regulator of exopolysaccharide synthesis, competence and biofilm formation [Streptococcus phage Javan84]MBF0776001.1 helix-turn-helix transcriptional regulator [Streptococcus sp. 19428wD3_AN2]MBF0787987.1 helix-turn-helix transcriptional regulator [Streptococcus sp. 19428wC2_LYSM12]ONK26334.1 p
MVLESKEIFSQNLAYFMNKKGVDRNQLCTDLDLKYTTVRDWLKGITYPRIGKIELLANYFGINKSDLIESKYYQKDTPSPDAKNDTVQAINDTVVQLHPERQENVLEYATEQLDEQEKEQLEKRKTLEISEPLFEYYVYEKLSAGTGATYWEERNYDTVYFDKEITHDLASWVYGDSMEPTYLDGSVALIKDTGFDYDGAIYAVDWDGQSYIKKVYKEKDGLRLVSLNSKYADKFAPYTEDPRIIGKVVGNFMPMER